jgi:FkbM family methyltransferase
MDFRTSLGFLYHGDVEDPGSLAHHLVRGVPEPFEIHLADFFLSRIRTFLDVGCNTGLYCLRAAQIMQSSARIVAFDPQSACIDHLRRTIELNQWGDRIRCEAVGLGDCEGELVLTLAEAGSSFDPQFNAAPDLPTTSARVRTLDQESIRLGLDQIDMIKIDVEGFELKVLRGGARTIERDRPVLLIEIADRIRGRTFRNPDYAATLSWLFDHGYLILRCEEDFRLTRIVDASGHEHICTYLCLHGQKHAHWVAPVERRAARFRRRNRVAAIVGPALNRRTRLVGWARRWLPPAILRLARNALGPRQIP